MNSRRKIFPHYVGLYLDISFSAIIHFLFLATEYSVLFFFNIKRSPKFENNLHFPCCFIQDKLTLFITEEVYHICHGLKPGCVSVRFIM